MLHTILLICLLIGVAAFGESKTPPLTPRDARIKVTEILKAHVSYQHLTHELIRRTLSNFLEELDPGKTYLLRSEVSKWVAPSDALLQTCLEHVDQEDFTEFEEMHDVMINAIERRNQLERMLSYHDLPKNVVAAEFKHIDWPETSGELSERLLRIRALQLEAAKKLDEATLSEFVRRLDKRRLNREEELRPRNKTEKQRLMLVYFLKAISAALDSQTAYFTPAEANQFMIQVQQHLYGIGAQLKDDLTGFTIIRLLEGGPAKVSNKLKVGDRIIAVDHQPVVGFDIVEAVELIRGPQGTPVHLTIVRQSMDTEQKVEERLDIEIIRDEVVLKETRLETNYEPCGAGVIGYLHLFSFYQDGTSSSAQDLATHIARLKHEHNLQGIVLDLRNNAGGLLPQAVAVTGLFIGKGVVVSVKDHSGTLSHLRHLEDRIAWDGPLIVLVNSTSASAAEIVAQTLQDYGRAVIVGDTTFGKGTFQTFTLELNNFGKVNPKGEFKVTRGRYYTVSGKSPQLHGVSPDIIVPGLFAEMEIGERFSKFPLDNEQIAPNFQDNLSDIPAHHRLHFARLYRNHLQEVLTRYRTLLPQLKKNSQDRIALNTNYQKFLQELSQKDLTAECVDRFHQFDLQLGEAMNIMKDLLLLERDSAITQQAEALPAIAG